MNKTLNYFYISFLLVFVYSCTKTETITAPKQPNTIVGLWIGTAKAVNESNAGALYESFDLRKDSTILVQGMGADGITYYSDGKWSLSGSAFTATYTTKNFGNAGAVQQVTAVYDSTNEVLAGSWQNVGTTATGTLSLEKVK